MVCAWGQLQSMCLPRIQPTQRNKTRSLSTRL